MSDQDLSHLLEQPTDERAPLWIYVFLPLFLLIVLLILALFYPLLPSSLQPPAHWLGLSLGGLILMGFLSLLLLGVLLKDRTSGLALIGLLTLGWLVWALLIPKPASPIPLGRFGSAPAYITALILPLLIALVVFLVGLYIVSGFLLPVLEKDGQRNKVLGLLFSYLLGFNRPCWVVTDEPREEDKIVERVKGSPFLPSMGPGVIITDCDHAVAVSDGIRFKGIQGPGVVFTEFGDQPLRLLDLRPQLRTSTVYGRTKDGIDVKVLFFAPFQIERSSGQEPHLGAPFPFQRRAATAAVHAQKMEHPGTGGEEISQRAWDELPVIIGTRVMQDLFSRYRFDELYEPFEAGKEPPRVRIAKEFAKKLREELQPLGIYLVGGGISNLLPANEAVLKQRVRSWQADWVRRVTLERARSQAEWLLRVEQARAEARADLILALGERLADLDRRGVSIVPEKVISQFLEILEELALRPSLRRYLPRDTARDVHRLREGLD